MSTEGRLSAGGGGDGEDIDGDAATSKVAATPASSRCSQGRDARAARWHPGQLLYYAPGAGDLPWKTASEELREATILNGRPVLLVDAHLPHDEGMLVADGRFEFAAPSRDLVPVAAEDVGHCSRLFAHASASPSPRCASPSAVPTSRPSPLAWLSPAGLQSAGHATFEVAGRALRHIVGRGGATIRRLEAGLGVLIGVADSPGGSAAVSLCGPSARLPNAERVVRLIGQGHRSLLERLEEDPGTWAGSGAED